MAMGAASSSQGSVLRQQLARRGQVVADRLVPRSRGRPLLSQGCCAANLSAAPFAALVQATKSSRNRNAWPPPCRRGASFHSLFVENSMWPAFSIVKLSTIARPNCEPVTNAADAPTRAVSVTALGERVAASQAFVQEFGVGDALVEVDWDSVSSWVVFSDLHLSRRTLDVCLQTLQVVHREAAARGAGVLFLGDFWHERGALPVEPLNQVLQVMQAWKRPTLMIPGNHDQVSIGGDVHSLTPLEAASPYIRVLHEPTVLFDALFVPYRRDHALVLEAMKEHTDVKAVFAHIDVAGAFMNDSFQAKEGIEKGDLRTDVPIYTGHYHKPHTVEGSSVRYIGSPYQVSRSEAGQQKHLLVLDKAWKETEVVPLSIGPRHFSVAGEQPDLPADLRAGDCVRWEVPPEWALSVKKAKPSKSGPPNPVAETMALLRERGVEVEVVYPLPASTPRIQKAEELDAFSLFSKYAETVGLSPAAAARGRSLLSELDLPARALRKPRADVMFRRLELEGYGPFLSPTEYKLGPARGLRAITGSVEDGSPGTDSNGAGKTSLVMAPLWALTGSTDPRPGAEGGLLMTEVIHHEALSARVRLEGDVNGQPFVVERVAGRRSGLRFEYDGQERTQQEVRLTQDSINELIDTAALRRIVFHGQHAVGGLLEANDRDFKEELSRLMSLEVWVAASEACKRLLKAQRSELEHLGGAAEELQNRLAAYGTEIERTRTLQQEFAVWKESEVETLESRLAAAQGAQSTTVQRCLESAARLDAAIKETTALLSGCEDRLLDESLGAAYAGPAAAVSAEEEEAAALAQEAHMELVDKRAQVRNAAALVDSARARLATFSAANQEAAICERCLQPVTGEHLATSIAAMRADLGAEEARYAQLRQDEAEIAGVLQSAQALVSDMRATRIQAEAQHRQTEERRRAEARAERRELQQARVATSAAERVRDEAIQLDPATFEALRSTTGALDERGDVGSTARGSLSLDEPSSGVSTSYGLEPKERSCLEQLDGLKREVQGQCQEARDFISQAGQLERQLRDARSARDPHEAQMATLLRMEEQVQADLASRQDAVAAGEAEVALLQSVGVAVGLSGIQSYVLESALAELEARAAVLLETLSGGTLVLHLAATKMGRATKREQEKIEKLVRVRLSDGRIVDRSLRQLSGGERQRVAVALQLAYADLAAQRSGVHSDLIVLDEAFQHLDSVGRSRMLRVLRSLPQGSVLVVSQANGELAGMFDLVDVVAKQEHTATLRPGPE